MLRHRPFAVVAVFALERDQLLVGEAPHGFSQYLNFFGKVEVHDALSYKANAEKNKKDFSLRSK
jgi:hypothetical protein